MTGLIFILGVVVTFLFIARLLLGDWKTVLQGIGIFFGMMILGAVGCAVIIGVIGLWAFISMALTGNLP